MERLLTRIALAVALCVTLLLPGVTFYVGYYSQRSILVTEAEINARLVSRLINENPELWRMVVLRLEELLKRRPRDGTPEARRVFDDQGLLVAESVTPLDGPLMDAVMPVHDAGHPVGHLQVQRSMRSLLLRTAAVGLLGLLLGAAVFITLTTLPLRALRRASASLEREATHDALTSLPNRALFKDRLEQAMLRAQRSQRPLAVFFLDLDQFKNINDAHGHHVGDQVLLHVAREVERCVREGTTGGRRGNDGAFTVARLGGDEFTVLVESAGSVDAISALAERLLGALRQPVQLWGQLHDARASIGIAMYPHDEIDVAQLMRHADMAMYRAKECGRDTYHFFDNELNAAIQRRISLDQSLHGALERGEFELHYQPLADLRTGRITSVEALLRWRPPGSEPVPPDQFIGLLEANGLIVPVGGWVVETACAQLAAWDLMGLAGLTLSVNVSPRQFRDPELPARVASALAGNGLTARRLELELTEGLLMEDSALSQRVLERLMAVGLRIAIDDFGTGYSSLAYLKRFSVHTLKLDRSFVSGLPEDAESAAIASAVVALAHNLGLAVICEGVETEAQRETLRRLGAEFLQGFVLSRPMPAEACTAWLLERLGNAAGRASAA